MTNEVAVKTADMSAAVAEQVLIKGDLSGMSHQQKLEYYAALCHHAGISPVSRPFQYLTLNGKLTLYATKDATDQLRSRDHVSTAIVAREVTSDVYVVTARASTPDGRTDESIGAVSIANLKGDALANAMMKAETKAKRRATLSLCGLGMLDETETETIAGAEVVTEDGELVPADVHQQLRELAGKLARPAQTALRERIESECPHVTKDGRFAIANLTLEEATKYLNELAHPPEVT